MVAGWPRQKGGGGGWCGCQSAAVPPPLDRNCPNLPAKNPFDCSWCYNVSVWRLHHNIHSPCGTYSFNICKKSLWPILICYYFQCISNARIRLWFRTKSEFVVHSWLRFLFVNIGRSNVLNPTYLYKYLPMYLVCKQVYSASGVKICNENQLWINQRIGYFWYFLIFLEFLALTKNQSSKLSIIRWNMDTTYLPIIWRSLFGICKALFSVLLGTTFVSMLTWILCSQSI